MNKTTDEWVVRGWGYEELAERWNIPNPWKDEAALADENREIDMELANAISEYMLDAMSLDDDDKNQKRVASDTRKFLLKLAEAEERIGFVAPLWKGLAAIENDQTMLKFAAMLVRNMWS